MSLKCVVHGAWCRVQVKSDGRVARHGTEEWPQSDGGNDEANVTTIFQSSSVEGRMSVVDLKAR